MTHEPANASYAEITSSHHCPVDSARRQIQVNILIPLMLLSAGMVGIFAAVYFYAIFKKFKLWVK